MSFFIAAGYARRHEYTIPGGESAIEQRNVCLGFKAEMDKGQAKAKLREIISRETKDVAPLPPP